MTSPRNNRPSKAAIRQKRYRDRKNRNVFIWQVEVSEFLKNALLRSGHLEESDLENPDDRAAVLGWLLENTVNVEE